MQATSPPGAWARDSTRKVKAQLSLQIRSRQAGSTASAPFTEDEIFKGGRTTDKYCWSQAARCPMYVNKTMCLYALNRCASEPGFKTENVMKDAEIVDKDSYSRFLDYYGELCQRAADLKFAMEGEAQRLQDGEKNGVIPGGKDKAKRILECMATSLVAWSQEACEPFHANKVSRAAFKPISVAPENSDPTGT